MDSQLQYNNTNFTTLKLDKIKLGFNLPDHTHLLLLIYSENFLEILTKFD